MLPRVLHQLVGDAGDAHAAMLLRFGDHAGIGLLAAIMDDAGDLGDLARPQAFAGPSRCRR